MYFIKFNHIKIHNEIIYLFWRSHPSDHDTLAEPIPSNTKPIVLFCGEATHSDMFSTTHGAYLTGLRESERILKTAKNLWTLLIGYNQRL